MVLQTHKGDTEKTLEWFLGGGSDDLSGATSPPPLIEDPNQIARPHAPPSAATDIFDDHDTGGSTDGGAGEGWEDGETRSEEKGVPAGGRNFLIRDETYSSDDEEEARRRGGQRTGREDDYSPSPLILFSGG